jgi:hypothetical protein
MPAEQPNAGKLSGLGRPDKLQSAGNINRARRIGMSPFVKEKAEQPARLGYIAFAVNIYGKGTLPQETQEAAKTAGLYRADRDLMVARAVAGLDELNTKAHRISAFSRIKASDKTFCDAKQSFSSSLLYRRQRVNFHAEPRSRGGLCPL